MTGFNAWIASISGYCMQTDIRRCRYAYEKDMRHTEKVDNTQSCILFLLFAFPNYYASCHKNGWERSQIEIVMSLNKFSVSEISGKGRLGSVFFCLFFFVCSLWVDASDLTNSFNFDPSKGLCYDKLAYSNSVNPRWGLSCFDAAIR